MSKLIHPKISEIEIGDLMFLGSDSEPQAVILILSNMMVTYNDYHVLLTYNDYHVLLIADPRSALARIKPVSVTIFSYREIFARCISHLKMEKS